MTSKLCIIFRSQSDVTHVITSVISDKGFALIFFHLLWSNMYFNTFGLGQEVQGCDSETELCYVVHKKITVGVVLMLLMAPRSDPFETSWSWSYEDITSWIFYGLRKIWHECCFLYLHLWNFRFVSSLLLYLNLIVNTNTNTNPIVKTNQFWMLHNEATQTRWLKPMHIYYDTVFVGQESGHSLMGPMLTFLQGRNQDVG